MANETMMIWRSNSPEIVFTHIVDAPRELVYKAWTDPSLLANWWGPHGFTNPVCELDVRPGGTRRTVVRSPEGTDYPASGVYREVVAPERLVYTDSFAELPAEWHDLLKQHLWGATAKPLREAIVAVTFEAQGSKTLLTVTTRFEPVEYRDAVLGIGMPVGWSQSLERLDALLAEQVVAYRKAA